MVIYDSDWQLDAYYLLGKVQTNKNYGALETSFGRGIGFLLWKDRDSFNLLKKFYDYDPTLFTDQRLIDPLLNNTPWDFKRFDYDEFVNIRDILLSENSMSIQDEYWNEYIQSDIELLDSLVYTDRDTSLLAEVILYLSNERDLNFITNNCGGARGTTPEQLRQSALITQLVCLDRQKVKNAYSELKSNSISFQKQARADWIKGNRHLSDPERQNNAKIVYSNLKGSGWSTNAIAGVLGNMEHESDINPGIWQNLTPGAGGGGGWGLVQWTPWTKFTDWADQNGYQHDDGDAQLEWIDEQTIQRGQWGPTDKYPMGFNDFKKSTRSCEELASTFLYNFEKPSDIESKDPQRRSSARKWLNYLTENGSTNVGNDLNNDGNPDQDTNTGETTPDTDSTPEAPLPDVTEELEVDSFNLKKMIKVGNEYHIIGSNNDSKPIQVRMLIEGNKIYTPNKVRNENVAGGGDGTGVSVTPSTPEEPRPPKKPTPIPPAGSDKAVEFVNRALSLVGQIKYSMESHLDTDRFSFSDGYADCSSFVCTLYYEITGEKLYNNNGVLCDYTGNLYNAGTLIASGSNGANHVPDHADKIQTADIIVMQSVIGAGGGQAHVVIAVDNTQIVHCTGGSRRTVVTDPFSYFSGQSGKPHYHIVRVF